MTVVFVLLLALLCSAVAQAAPGDLDTTFGLGGETQVPFAGLARAGALALTPDGGSVVAGFTVVPGCGCNEYALARFTAAGVLDPRFGAGGTETLGATANIAGGVVVEPDESIVVTGSGNGDTTDDFVTKRLNPDGTVDASFGTGGTSVVDFGADDEAFAMAQQPDGKFVIAGATGTENANGTYTSANFAITRLNGDGSLDTSFGTDGKQTVDFGGVDEAEGVAVQPDGKIVVTGFGGALNDLVATRLNADGSVDTSFGTNGRAYIYFGGTAYGGAMALQGDGKILLVGSTVVNGVSQFAVARLTAGGALDPTFNASGKLTLAYGPKAAAASVAVQQNGKIVVLGDGGAGQDFIVARLNPDGSQDMSFGTGGAADVDFGLDEEDGSVALQPDGNILIAGSSGSDDANGNLVTGDFAIARLLGDPVTGGGTGGGGGGGGGTGGGGGGGGTGTGGGTGGGGTGTGSPTASFTAPRTVPKLGPVMLDASATTGATKLLWDVDGDGHADFIRTPSEPALVVRLVAPTTLHVTLTAVAANGATSTATHTVVVTGSMPSSALLNKIRPVATAVSAMPSFFAAASQAGASCSTNPQTLTFGLAETIGCFDHITDFNQVPILERQIVLNHYDSPQYPEVVSNICAQARGGLLPKTLCTSAADLYSRATENVYVSHHTVKLNGISITPVGPASVVVYPSVQRVISSFAIVKWGNFPVDVGPIDWDLHTQAPSGSADYQHDPAEHPFPPAGRAALLSFDLSNLGEIAGFDPTGQVALSLQTVNGQYSSAGAVNLALPSEFTVFGGKAPTAAVSLTLNNTQSDPVLDHLDLEVPEADFGGVSLTHLGFRYERYGGIDGDLDSGLNGTGCNSDEWKATADVFLLGNDADTDPDNDGNTALLMAPQPTSNGLVFCDGHFKRAGAVLQFGGPIPPPEVFPGVFIDGLNFYFQLDPTVIKAGATLSVAEVVRITGSVLAVFATQGQHYILDPGTAGPEFQGLAGHTFTSTALAIGGTVAIHVPGVGDLNIAHGNAVYVYPSYFGFGVSASDTLGIFSYTGDLSFQMDVARGLFEGDADAHICVVGFDLCAGGLLVASEKGAVACLNFHTKVFGHKIEINPGVGVRTNGHVDVWIPDGCKPSHYWSAVRGEFSNSARAAGAAQPPIGFTVAKGETSKSLKIGGQGGAPRVLIQGPGGARLSVAGDGTFASGALEAISAGKYSTTWLGVKDGRPGRYTITPLPGSVRVTSFAQTRPGYDTNFAAHVTGHGSRLVLHYDARKRGGGQKVTFFEDGAKVMHPLVTSTGGAGTVRFTPAPGDAGTRTIVARATVDDSPIQSQTLAHFHFAGTPRTGRPGRVRIRRRGGRLTVRWTAGAGASHYGVVLRLADGSMRTFRLGTRRSLSIGGVPLDQGGTVQVSTQGVFNDWSKPRAASFQRLRAPFSVLLTNKHNERHHKQ